jgi:hypothetical protein
VVTASGQNFIAYGLCRWVQIGPLVGFSAIQLALVATAFDRLFSAAAPIL